MNDFLQYILYLFHRGVRFAVPAVLLCVVGLAAAWGIARKQGRSFPWKKAAALLLLIAWLGLTLFVTLFRGEPGYRQWNFHLFLAWKEAWNQFALRVWLNVLLNIAVRLWHLPGHRAGTAGHRAGDVRCGRPVYQHPGSHGRVGPYYADSDP